MDCSLPGSSVHGIFQARGKSTGLPLPSPGFPWDRCVCLVVDILLALFELPQEFDLLIHSTFLEKLVQVGQVRGPERRACLTQAAAEALGPSPDSGTAYQVGTPQH